MQWKVSVPYPQHILPVNWRNLYSQQWAEVSKKRPFNRLDPQIWGLSLGLPKPILRMAIQGYSYKLASCPQAINGSFNSKFFSSWKAGETLSSNGLLCRWPQVFHEYLSIVGEIEGRDGSMFVQGWGALVVDAVDAVNAVDAVESVVTIDAVESVVTIDAVERVVTIDGWPVDNVGNVDCVNANAVDNEAASDEKSAVNWGLLVIVSFAPLSLFTWGRNSLTARIMAIISTIIASNINITA